MSSNARQIVYKLAFTKDSKFVALRTPIGRLSGIPIDYLYRVLGYACTFSTGLPIPPKFMFDSCPGFSDILNFRGKTFPMYNTYWCLGLYLVVYSSDNLPTLFILRKDFPRFFQEVSDHV